MKIYELIQESIIIPIWNNIILVENREAYVLSTFGNKLSNVQHDQQARGLPPEQIIQKLVGADPSKNKQYLLFLAKLYSAGQFRLEDVNRIKQEIQKFEKVKPKLPQQSRDINRISSLRDLYALLEPFEDQEVKSKRSVKQDIKQQGAKTIIDTPNFKVIIPTTKEAACFYGRGTKWCTAATESDNMFDHYNQQGSLYVIIAGDRKFQLHMEADQFMDEHDNDISSKDIAYLSKYPEYKQFLEMLINKHYYGNE